MVVATAPMYIPVQTVEGHNGKVGVELHQNHPVVLDEPVLLEESWLAKKLQESCPVHKYLFKEESKGLLREEDEKVVVKEKKESKSLLQEENGMLSWVQESKGLLREEDEKVVVKEKMESKSLLQEENAMLSWVQAPPAPPAPVVPNMMGTMPMKTDEELAGLNDWGFGGDEEIVASMMQALGDEFSGWDQGTCSCMRGDRRWWTRSPQPLLCPITGFPINHLPYPPFKLRVDPLKPNPYKLVDGKSLAIMFIVNPGLSACGRELLPSDLHALDLYMQRCKLGPFRPARMLELQCAVTCSCNVESRNAAVTAVVRYCKDARAELGRLRKIQEGRLSQIMQGQAGRSAQTGRAEKKRGSRKNSDEKA